jgi:hypothetical protein
MQKPLEESLLVALKILWLETSGLELNYKSDFRFQVEEHISICLWIHNILLSVEAQVGLFGLL